LAFVYIIINVVVVHNMIVGNLECECLSSWELLLSLWCLCIPSFG